MMKKEIGFWLGLVFVLSLLMAACSGTTPTPQTEEPKSAEIVVTEEPKPVESVATEEPTAESMATEEPTAESVSTEESTAESVVTEKPKTTGPRTGDIAPDLKLPDSNGNMVHLADELDENRKVILVFYHAYF